MEKFSKLAPYKLNNLHTKIDYLKSTNFHYFQSLFLKFGKVFNIIRCFYFSTRTRANHSYPHNKRCHGQNIQAFCQPFIHRINNILRPACSLFTSLISLSVNTSIKKRGNCLSSVPLIEAFALPDTAEQTTLEPTPI